ncbi:MAG: 1,4-alpha-glucan branching protein GlgB [Clostridia bacterium]|nr:1,4-alpha-glucan branching protein GlgB [Clostridia bacterium]
MNENTITETSNLAEYLFHQGTNFKAQEYLGCHKTDSGYVFRVWAPGAQSVSLCADFTSWNEGRSMSRESDGGIWCVSIDTARSLEGMPYKYRVIGRGGDHLKSDPYALYFEKPPRTASLVYTDISYDWNDSAYLRKRRNDAGKSKPMNIYEVHAGSWLRREVPDPPPGTPEEEVDKGDLSWRELADLLSDYVCDMGFTHVELLPITEHPYDLSWGYQVSGYFAPTARHGTPADFKYFVDRLHSCGIGVILDWVPAHFPRDRHGLFEFDGGPLYEYQGADRMEHAGWGTRFFDVGREEVQSFLISSAIFWLEEYHIDGLRVDAAASMLYLDYDRAPGEWVPNVYGGRENLEAMAFLRKLNTEVFARFPDAVMAAEESTAWPMVTRPVHDGGLGFSHKWNMGFANDMYDYLACDPYFRRHIHDRLTFPMMYAFSENYIIPVSHDEVVHGKKSLIDKMYGEYDDKFSLMRTYLAFMYAMPGRKLLFMGTEFAQFREWDCEHSLEWFMLDYPRHREMREFVRRLCHIYKSASPLWEDDFGWDGFSWIDADHADDNLVSFIRRDRSGREIYCIFHFSPATVRYTFPVKTGGKYEVMLSTDKTEFGGAGKLSEDILTAEKNEGGAAITAELPGNCAMYIRKAPPARKSASSQTVPQKRSRKTKKEAGNV